MLLGKKPGLETLGTLETLRREAQLKRVYWQKWLQNSNRECSSLGTHHAHHLSIIEWQNKILNISVSVFICDERASCREGRGAHLCNGFHGNLQNPDQPSSKTFQQNSDQPSSPRRPIYAGEGTLGRSAARALGLCRSCMHWLWL